MSILANRPSSENLWRTEAIATFAKQHKTNIVTHGETRTRNLRFRRPTPYPLGHAGWQLSFKSFKLCSRTDSSVHFLTNKIEGGEEKGMIEKVYTNRVSFEMKW